MLNSPKRKKSTSTVHGNREELLAKLRTLIGEKESKLKQKQAVDAELKSLNQLVVKKVSHVLKIQLEVLWYLQISSNS